MQRLAGKVLIVAGAGGIGNALARRYALEGARLVIGDRNGELAVKIASEIGTGAIGVEFDGTDETSAARLVAKAREAFGGMDGIHINFASFADAFSEAGLDIPMEMFDEVTRVNTRGYFLCARAAVPALVERGGGTILFTSSMAAYVAEPVRIAYAMSKSAVNALVRGIASRHGKDNIRCNAIAPGIIHHEFQPVQAEALQEWAFSLMALKTRLGKPEDLAGISATLMSDDGSHMTGQIISVDGGIVMRP